MKLFFRNVKCAACEAFVETLQLLVRLNASEDEIVYLITKACISLGIEDERVSFMCCSCIVYIVVLDLDFC